MKKGSDFSWEVLEFVKKGSDFSREVLKFTKKGSQKTECFGHARRKLLFYEVFLKVVFKKHVNYNEKITFRNIRKKREKRKKTN